jgi:hypothetical protein
MPPQLPVLADPNRIAKTMTSSQSVYAKAFVLALVVVTALRLAFIRHMSKKKEMSTRNLTAVAPEKCPSSCPELLEKVSRHAESFGGQDETSSAPIPLYPWISPPQPLPGPYDPRLYPLPTIRRHSYDPPANDFLCKKSAEASYTRRVSLNSMPTQQRTLHGTVVISPKGWRRNQWIVSGE